MHNSENLKPLQEHWTLAEMSVSYKATGKIDHDVDSTEKAYRIFMELWDYDLINVQEQLAAIYLNNELKVIAYRLITTGNINSTTIDTPLIVSCALQTRSNGIILAHNHPSGSLNPSTEDIKATKQIYEACKLFKIKLVDHLIVTPNDFNSIIDLTNT